MGTVREIRSRSEDPERPVVRLVVLDGSADAKIIHFHRARSERRPVRILHPSMFSDGSFPWDPDDEQPHASARESLHDER